MNQSPQLSVILLTWNSEKDIPACISSVVEATADIKCEIIVVDNGSSDSSIGLISNFPVMLIKLEKNMGISCARNIGIRAAKGNFIWILDIDTVVNREAVHGMIDYLENDKDCGLCACRLISSDGDIQDSCRSFPWIHYKIINFLAGAWKIKSMEKYQHNQFYRSKMSERKPFNVEYVIGACQMFRRSIINKIGMLDEQIFYGPEDADFCLRIGKAGYRVTYLPQFNIIHHYKRLTHKSLLSTTSRHHIMGLLHFYIKNSF